MNRDAPSQMRSVLLATAALAVVVGVCMVYVDRPLALWLDVHYRHLGITTLARALFTVLDPLLLLGGVALLVAGAWLWWARNPPAVVGRFVIAGMAAAVTLAVTVLLKWCFGRSTAFLFVEYHAYAYRPFAGSGRFWAFPSATMSVSSAFLAALGLHAGLGRAAAQLVLVLLAAALLVTNSHWASDVVAGTFIGLVVGFAFDRGGHGPAAEEAQ